MRRIRPLVEKMLDELVDQVRLGVSVRDAALIDRLIAVLDEWDGEVDAEDAGDFEASDTRPHAVVHDEADHSHI
jgi:hypothetical protein